MSFLSQITNRGQARFIRFLRLRNYVGLRKTRSTKGANHRDLCGFFSLRLGEDGILVTFSYFYKSI